MRAQILNCYFFYSREFLQSNYLQTCGVGPHERWLGIFQSNFFIDVACPAAVYQMLLLGNLKFNIKRNEFVNCNIVTIGKIKHCKYPGNVQS